jgi:hypothetical protein
MSSWITPRRFFCKPVARLTLRKSSPLGRSHKDGTSKPGGYHLHEATAPLYLGEASRGIGGSSTFANYAVWKSAERFAHAFDNID